MTSLIDFGFDSSAPATTTTRRPAPVVVETVPQVVETVTVKPTPSVGFVMRPDEQWGWQDLRDYVMGEIEKRHGPQVRNPKTESSIFKSFLTRHPEKAVAIARSAFEVHNGMWRSAPISVNRFCKASDPYFADVLAANV